MHLLRKIFAVTLQPYIVRRIHRTSFFTWRDIVLRIPPGVFHPKYFFSTKYLLDFVLKQPLQNKKLLELGAGSGLISIACAKREAEVYASDISKKVIATLHENAVQNKVSLHIVESDLFDSMPSVQFDLIVINPPYYPKDPKNEMERAWFCGTEYEYFKKLFLQMGKFVKNDSRIWMILSEDCNLEAVFSNAQKNNFTFREVSRKRMFWEWNYIFEIVYGAA